MQNLQTKSPFRQHRRITRRYIFFALGYTLVLSTILFGCHKLENKTQSQVLSSNSKNKVVRIVRSKQLTALAVLEKQGNLQKRLQSLGYKLEWPEFAAGPQQLEALNAGNLDIASTAESPPIFAQAAGTPLVYLSANSPDPKAVSLLVPLNSPIKSVRDLKGKK